MPGREQRYPSRQHSVSALADAVAVELDRCTITGDRSLNPLFSWWIVPHSHTSILQREQVIEQVLSILATGRFVDPWRRLPCLPDDL